MKTKEWQSFINESSDWSDDDFVRVMRTVNDNPHKIHAQTTELYVDPNIEERKFYINFSSKEDRLKGRKELKKLGVPESKMKLSEKARGMFKFQLVIFD